MGESLLSPSANWFQVSGIVASPDGWLIYGALNRCLCVMEPMEYKSIIAGDKAYKIHLVNKAHSDRIVSIDISLEWPEKRCFLTGCVDGSVKQWTIETKDNKVEIKSPQSHDRHSNFKEEIIGVGYSGKEYALTLGYFGYIVKWHLKSNVVKTYNQFLKNLKPLCMSCSPHMPLQLAVGTKQGVIMIIDLNGNGKMLYKLRGHDDEIISLSWCPQYEVTVNKRAKIIKKSSTLSQRLDKIRNEPEEINKSESQENETLNKSGIEKNLPDDSFEESIVIEDDTFDIYKDHEHDEFGHKKYEPEEVYVKVKENKSENDFLAECMKLKEDILKKKNEPEQTIQSLVEAMEKAQVNGNNKQNDSELDDGINKNDVSKDVNDHVTHKHLLASICKYGLFRIWSKGELIGNCAVKGCSKNLKQKGTFYPSVLWYTADKLIISDGKFNVCECNPLEVNHTNRMETHVLHSGHKRSPYCIITNAPRVQTSDDGDWSIWSAAQDRQIIKYSMKYNRVTRIHSTCGGHIYTIQTCPYDAGKIAFSVGDGTVRVWETGTLDDDETRLCLGQVTSYWQRVQGKVLTVAWHPTRENLLAFSTAEARVGLLETGGSNEKAARVLIPYLTGPVYVLCWGENNDLYACSEGKVVLYKSNKPNDPPEPILMEVEGEKWSISELRWYQRGLVLGSNHGGIAVVQPAKPFVVNAVIFVYKKLMQSIDWHPQETSNSLGESVYKNLIAVTGINKEHSITILDYKDKEDGGKELVVSTTLFGHKNVIHRVLWNPHTDGQLLTSSRDSTIRVWDVPAGVCISVFSGHVLTSIGIAWSPFPHQATKVLSGGGDSTVRLWDINDFPADNHKDTYQIKKVKRKYTQRNEIKRYQGKADTKVLTKQQLASTLEIKLKVSKKYIIPTTHKQSMSDKSNGIKLMVKQYLEKQGRDVNLISDGIDYEQTKYIKMFGSINDINELLDFELERHLNNGSYESWMVLSLFRGHINTVVQFAVERDMLCPFIISLTPCVSSKYWKEVSQLYISQIDRLVAKVEENKLSENRHFGGPSFRKALTFLSIHDIVNAVNAFKEARLFKEAYILCRIRYMDSVAEELLDIMAKDSEAIGHFVMAAACYVARDNISGASSALSKSDYLESLSLAVELAKLANHNSFADHIVEKINSIKNTEEANVKNNLNELPTRAEALNKDRHDYDCNSDVENYSTNVYLKADSNAEDSDGEDKSDYDTDDIDA